MHVLKRLLAVLALLAMTAGGASADWRTQNGLDVATGQASVLLIGDLDQNTALYARCVGDELTLQVESYDGRDEAPIVGPVRLIITTDAGGRWEADAVYERARPGYINIAFDSPADVPGIVAGLIAAKASVSVNVEFVETGDLSGWDATAKGSTAAGRKFLADCGLEASPAPAAVSSPEGAWQVVTGPDDVNGGQSVRVYGDLDQGGYFYAYCDGKRQPLMAFISTNAATFPYEAGDVGLVLRVEIDGETVSATGEHFSQPDGIQGIYYTQLTNLQRILETVASARETVAMEIESYSNGMITRWPAKNLRGLAEAMAAFREQCFAGSPTVAETDDPQPPEAPAASVDPDWRYVLQEEPTTNHLAIADTSLSAGFGISCTDGLSSVIVLANVPARLGISEGATSARIVVSLRGVSTPFEAFVHRADDGRVVLIADAYADVSELINRLLVGEGEITVTVDAGGGPVEMTIPPTGQGAAVRQFYNGCTPGGDSVAGRSWIYSPGADAPEYGAKAVLLSPPRTEDGVFLVLACSDAEGFYAYLLSPNPAALPIADGGQAALSIIAGQTTWELEELRSWAFASSTGVRGTGSIVEIVGVMSLGPERFLATLADRTSGESWDYDLGGTGASDAALDFFSSCLI